MKPVWPDNFGPKVMSDLKSMMGNGLTFKDNLDCAIVTIDAQHNVETRVSNPLRSVPLAFIPIDSMSITAVGGVSNGVARPIEGWPVLNTSRTDGFIGITCAYAAPFGELAVSRTSNFTIPDSSYTAIEWNTNIYVGGNLSHSLTTSTENIVCAVPGIVEVEAHATFPLSAGYKAQYFDLNGDAIAYGYTSGASDIASYFSHPSVARINVTVPNDYFSFKVANVGAATTITGRLTARYVSPPLTALGRVRGILVGA